MAGIESFVEERLSDEVERGARGGPRFLTGITPLDSGFERRNSVWESARGEWDIGYGIEYQEDYIKVRDFFYAMRGRLCGFRFRDWSDYQVNQILDTGTASSTQVNYQAFKRYQVGSNYYDRVLRKLVPGSYQVLRNGSALTETTSTNPTANQFNINVNTGAIKLGRALTNLEQLRLVAEFDVPVRFDTDKLDMEIETFEAASVPSIPVIELKQL